MDSCFNNNSTPGVGTIPYQGSLEKISHKPASAHKGSDQFQTSSKLRRCRRSYVSPTIRSTPRLSTSISTESQSQEPLSSGMSADWRIDRDVVTETMTRKLNQDRGSRKSENMVGRHHVASMAYEDVLNGQSHSYARRRRGSSLANLDVNTSRQEPRVGSTASTLAATAEKSSVDVDGNRGFRARLILSQARKAIENHKPTWSVSPRGGRQIQPFIMDVILELKAQYAGYSTEDVFVTFEAMRRNEDSRPVFEYLAHDFSAGAESVDAYWEGQARVWRGWKTPGDGCVGNDVDNGVGNVGGSTFPVGFSLDPVPDDGVDITPNYNIPPAATSSYSAQGPFSSTLPVGRAHFPDSIERSTASWCPVLNCDYVARYHK